MKNSLLFILIFVTQVTQAELLSTSLRDGASWARDAVAVPSEKTTYVHPNEQFPQLAKPILSNTDQGIYISVGTERGFIGAAMSPMVNHLLLIDKDPQVLLFNTMNVSFLKMAKGREDFNYLRDKAPLPEVLERMKIFYQNEPELLRMLNKDTLAWWKRIYRDSYSFDDLRGEHPTGGQNTTYPFEGVNYTKSDSLFRRVQNMAKAGKIGVLSANLSDPSEIAVIKKYLDSRIEKVAVLDLSNAWWKLYTGDNSIYPLMKNIEHRFSDKALVLLTHLNGYSWDYMGFQPKQLMEYFQTDFARISKPVVKLMSPYDKLFQTFSTGPVKLKPLTPEMTSPLRHVGKSFTPKIVITPGTSKTPEPNCSQLFSRSLNQR